MTEQRQQQEFEKGFREVYKDQSDELREVWVPLRLMRTTYPLAAVHSDSRYLGYLTTLSEQRKDVHFKALPLDKVTEEDTKAEFVHNGRQCHLVSIDNAG